MKLLVQALVSIFLLQACGVHPNENLESNYRKLETISAQIPKQGASEARKAELRRVRDAFESSGSEGAAFLVKKLQAMVTEELEFLGKSDDPAKGAAYLAHLHGEGQSNLRKYAVCNILADMFLQLNDGLQTAVLKAITSAYTPSSYGREDIAALNYTLARVGPKAVPYFLELANHRSAAVRSSVSEILESIATDSPQVSGHRAPKVNPNAPQEERSEQIRQWRSWWEEAGRPMPKTKLRSFFDTGTSKSG